MAKFIGILTAGGDSPGLNAAIRGIGKAALESYGMRVIGFRDGFRGLMEKPDGAPGKFVSVGNTDHRGHDSGHQSG